MALALCPFALIVDFGPFLCLCRLPGELIEGVTQGRDAPQTAMRFGIRPALKEDWRSACQGLQTGSVTIALWVIADFSQQARSETRARARQTQEDLAVGVTQKKLGDLLIIGSDVL